MCILTVIYRLPEPDKVGLGPMKCVIIHHIVFSNRIPIWEPSYVEEGRTKIYCETYVKNLHVI